MGDVVKLWQMWRELDADDSGDVDLNEFLRYYEQRGLKRAFPRKGLFGSADTHRSITLDHLMEVIWPRCGTEDRAWMRQVISNFRSAGPRAEALQELRGDDLSQLRDTFRLVDADGNGIVSLAELVSSNLMSEEQARETLERFNLDMDGELSLDDFMEVMCPVGYVLPARRTDGLLRKATA